MSDVTFAELAEEYLSQPTVKQGNKKSYWAKRATDRMVSAWGRKQVKDIKDRDVREFFRRISRLDIGNATKNNYVTYYRAVMHFARDELRAIDYVPKVKSLPEKPRTDFLEKAELYALAGALDPLRADIMWTAVYTGLRHSNVSHMKIEWLDKDTQHCTLPPEVTKNGSDHEVPLFGKAREIILRRLEIVEDLQHKHSWLPKIEYVFVQTGGMRKTLGKPLFHVTNSTWRNAVKKAGLKKGTRFHDLRHTFATMHKRAGTSDSDLQTLGGWKSHQSMERYRHVTSPELRKAAEKLKDFI